MTLGKIIIPSILLGLTCLFLIYFLWQNRYVYQEPFDAHRLMALYSWSQFANRSDHKVFTISDEDLYAYAGWYYLTTGELNQINIEHPPLGKYFIGLSILLFGNQNIGQIFWGILFLVFTYLLSLRLTKNHLLASGVILSVVLEPLFRYQLTHSLLDLPQTVFILIYLFAFSKIKHPLWLMVSGLSLGTAAAIKFPAAALILSLTSFLTIFYQKRSAWGKYLKRLLLINFFAFMVFTLAYLPLLLYSGINAWFDLLIKASKMHLSHVPQYPKGVVFLVLFFNQWPRWWGKGGIQEVLEWQSTWPLLGLGLLISPILAIKNRLLTKEPLLFFFVWSYLIFLASRLFFPAYLLPILPFGFLFLWLTPSLFLRK